MRKPKSLTEGKYHAQEPEPVGEQDGSEPVCHQSSQNTLVLLPPARNLESYSVLEISVSENKRQKIISILTMKTHNCRWLVPQRLGAMTRKILD